jgi:hypothetical protein
MPTLEVSRRIKLSQKVPVLLPDYKHQVIDMSVDTEIVTLSNAVWWNLDHQLVRISVDAETVTS